MFALSTRTRLATGAALLGFAANSLLCRAALRPALGHMETGAIDAWSFTAVRLGAGALTLGVLARRRPGSNARARGGSLLSALALYAYAGAFSLAYLRLVSGVGALVLFAAVQATMIGWGIARGARPSAREWIGVALAFGGLLVLTLPGASLPDPLGLVLMALAGLAWGVYSLRGRGSTAPLAATADNFARALPCAAFAWLAARLAATPAAPLHADASGIGLACASGALASGLGYSLWYLALPELSALHAALVQLTVPVLVALLGILLLGEELTLRLALATPLILGGVACAVLRRPPR